MRLMYVMPFLVVVACGPAAKPPPPPDLTPTWHRDVQPIVQARCAGCHLEGGLGPFTLTSYADAKPRHALLADSITTRRMPPWMPDETSCQSIKGSMRMTQEEIDTVVAWSAAGAPEGDIGHAKVAPLTATLPWVDQTVAPDAPYTPRANLTDDYHCTIMDPQLGGARDVIGFEVKPGSGKQVHHVLFYAVPGAAARARDARTAEPGWTCYGGPGVDVPNLLGGWVPGTSVVRFPGQTGVRMFPGDVIVMQIHYNMASGPPAPDLTQVNLQYSRFPVQYVARMFPVVESSFRIPPNAMDFTASETVEMPVDATLWGVTPHMHQLGKRITLELLPRPGETAANQCLVDIPRWDFNWQMFYFFDSKVGLNIKAGQSLKVSCTWDNTTSNEVRWGEGTEDEMCLAFIYVTGAVTPP